MSYERTRRIRPHMKLPTTYAWYLTWRAAHEGRDVAEVAARLLGERIAVEVARMTPHERRLMDMAMPGWMRYEGPIWSEVDGGSTRASRQLAEP